MKVLIMRTNDIVLPFFIGIIISTNLIHHLLCLAYPLPWAVSLILSNEFHLYIWEGDEDLIWFMMTVLTRYYDREKAKQDLTNGSSRWLTSSKWICNVILCSIEPITILLNQ